MDTGKPTPKIAENKVQETLHFRYLKFLVNTLSKNRGTPKWMVKIMENPTRMDDLGVPLFLETPM